MPPSHKKKKSYQKQKPQNVQTGQDATRLIELESATELVKQNALISALSIIILKEISVCNGQLSASASSFEAMQASVPASLQKKRDKKVKGFVTLVRADIQHLNRSEQASAIPHPHGRPGGGFVVPLQARALSVA